MPLYTYNGLERSGRAGTGTIEAEDIAVAAQQLRANGITITALAPAPPPASNASLAMLNPFAQAHLVDDFLGVRPEIMADRQPPADG